MKKLFIVVGILVVLFLATSVVAESISVSDDVENLVKDVAKTKGYDREDVGDVQEVDFADLPEEIKFANIDETNLALYSVNVTGEEKPVYIITASQTKLKKIVSKFTRKMFLNFGFGGEVVESTYLKSAVGVLGDLDKGYVMMREGSVSGISTNLEVISGEGEVEVLIYKNKELVGFRNTFKIAESGIYNDYDTVSEDILKFYPGDVISLYIKIEGDMAIKDVNSLLEVATD